DARFIGGGGEELQLLLGGQNAQNNYEIIFRGRGINDLLVRRIANGGYSDLIGMPLPTVLTSNQTNHYKVARRGNFIDCYFNNTYLTTVLDTTYLTGMAGLFTYTSNTLFDNVSIRPAVSGQ